VEFQQNSALPLPVVMIVAPNNRLETLAPFAPTVLSVLTQPLPRQLVRIEGPERVIRLPARSIER
jgi:hypothetical protein